VQLDVFFHGITFLEFLVAYVASVRKPILEKKQQENYSLNRLQGTEFRLRL
jgi:hypothetical protein